MKINTRIALGNLLIVGAGFLFLLWWIIGILDPQYRKATEEPLIDSSRILASFAGGMYEGGTLDTAKFGRLVEESYSEIFSARIYDFEKRTVDFRIYITDAKGTVLYDSYDRQNEGKDFSGWNDVARTIKGQYGARTTRDDPEDPASGVMYVASPIKVNGEFVGVLSLGKPTGATKGFVRDTKQKIVAGGAAVFFSVFVFSALVSGMLTKPIRRLTHYAKSVRDGKRGEPPALGTSEVRDLGEAFEEMREALEGKKYVENYVQTLTHEVKSPLSAIQGAAELIKEDMPPERRTQFIDNIISEAGRIEAVVEKLLLLSSLESKRSVHDLSRLDMLDILKDVKRALMANLEQKSLTLRLQGGGPAGFDGDRFLIRHSVMNLLQNAVEFSPVGGTITAEAGVSHNDAGAVVKLKITDEGPGVPDYALSRIFERFYSLKRPDSGKKSSGLGLSLVSEVAALHGGTIEVKNSPRGGAEATLTLPLRRA